ncbi:MULTISPECIES: nucleotidyl transferase AbiEii/AbiGii toxin family protein [unclassified Oceanispirochaeta]|uniref:nucleotidyl transferase AbiEii/AbiGii toxin family protein n=1 Tax=unclassified Oceanispirochaeta TaxID=2635722 RepID=UPI000E095123|nr:MULTISPECIES: nucleotidyl transferase AbiEii/AbiGii toxin family protein [unclassified Oceanispirochaeta]MBF9014690.1 nucleotidyl transferase AbiEii/AbiGii toxin family protein [Oceanispirochaeta sp. M2]NPD70946.1 nucleotidyl transferase AbiEii/AbiGii toxin family protein [Oceanispirochaeta sp. M1]RDG33780.1 hypothetical protein DV872_02440 [Oceanispirochaeta sp. M1]
MKNPAASIQARLLNLSRKEKKDFYDVYDILINKKIDSDILKEAIRQTFERRHTVLPQEPAVFQESFGTDTRNLQLWKAFLNRIKAEQIDFSVVIEKLREYLFPIYQELKE